MRATALGSHMEEKCEHLGGDLEGRGFHFLSFSRPSHHTNLKWGTVYCLLLHKWDSPEGCGPDAWRISTSMFGRSFLNHYEGGSKIQAIASHYDWAWITTIKMRPRWHPCRPKFPHRLRGKLHEPVAENRPQKQDVEKSLCIFYPMSRRWRHLADPVVLISQILTNQEARDVIVGCLLSCPKASKTSSPRSPSWYARNVS